MPTRQERIVISGVRRLLGGIALSLLLSTPAWSAACQVTVTPLAFGVYDVLAAVAREATAQVTIRCNHKSTAPATVQLRLSAGNSGNFGQRAMNGSAGGAPLYYNVFTAPGSAVVLGDGSGGSTTLTRVVDKSADWIVTLYGAAPPRQPVLVGTYGDALIATILY